MRDDTTRRTEPQAAGSASSGGRPAALRRLLGDIETFSARLLAMPLRPYQAEIARSVLRAIEDGGGRQLTVMLPRQSGKNELSAHLEAYLLTRRQRRGGSIVKCAPTYRPQVLVSVARLLRTLDNPLTGGQWRRRDGHIVVLGRASIAFYSAEPGAHVVGGTASLLLECDEAQDVLPDKWEKDFRPMAATANAASVLYGTPWTDDTLLARQVALNREAEARDGVRRHFQVDWSAVADANPAYGRHVEGEIARLGEHHPIVRTQYLLRTVAGGGRFLDAGQLGLLLGEHPPEDAPSARRAGPGAYVAGLDVAGEDEEDPSGEAVRVNPRRDSTVLTIAYAAQTRIGERVLEPRFEIVHQYAWRGDRHRELYPRILALVSERWRCRSVVVDATGVGGGLAAFLGAALGPAIVRPFRYTAASKSQLAYDFLSAVNAGRLKLYAEAGECPKETGAPILLTDPAANDLRRELLRQCEAAEYAMRAGQVMSFFVPEHRGHDDLLNAAALLVQAQPVGSVRTATGRRQSRSDR
ncbi:MAG: hypothetical protein IT306_09650 [Chloroflexi bacterium]|nr:hypothetical protein [Chloroflexota bacterium]